MGEGAILVTGGAGYIGSHAALALRDAPEGREVVALDDLSRGHRALVPPGVDLEVADLLDRTALRRVFAQRRIAAVMHFAAFAYVGESMGEPGLYYNNNLVGTLRLLEAMREFGVGRLVFSSSCAVYGSPRPGPIGEDTPAGPVNPYGESKLAVERMLGWWGRAYGLRWVALRYFNAAGADPEGRAGEMHDPETHAIPLLLRACEPGGGRFRVYGTDYPTADGTCVRDYVHVADLAEAHARAAEYLLGGGESVALNLGAGRGHSMRELIAAAGEVTGAAPRWEAAGRRLGDPAELVADARRARAVLGWEARHSDLATLLGTAWRWQRRGRGRSAVARAA